MATDLSSIVMSSRIRLARCLAKIPFPSRLSDEKGAEVLVQINNALKQLKLTLYKCKNLPEIDSELLREKHLISRDLIERKEMSGVLLSDDETIAIMINEEDHIREQCIVPGLALSQAYDKLNRIDDELLANLDIAFDSELGFLNSCITNVGTGMRASVMLFLPALTMLGEMNAHINSLSNQGFTVRGVYGEGSDGQGYMYQVSNSRCLGLSEKEIINGVDMSVRRLCGLEIAAREKLLSNNHDEILDKVYRSYGLLTSCYMLGAEEFMRLAGEVKIGLALGLLKFKDNHIIDKLIFKCMPSSLTKIAGKAMNENETNKFRAEYVRGFLSENRIRR